MVTFRWWWLLLLWRYSNSSGSHCWILILRTSKNPTNTWKQRRNELLNTTIQRLPSSFFRVCDRHLQQFGWLSLFSKENYRFLRNFLFFFSFFFADQNNLRLSAIWNFLEHCWIIYEKWRCGFCLRFGTDLELQRSYSDQIWPLDVSNGFKHFFQARVL